MSDRKKICVAAVLAAALLCACGQQPQSGPVSGTGPQSMPAAQSAAAELDADGVAEQLRELYGLNGERFSVLEVLRAEPAPPAEWDAWPRLEEVLTEEGITWREWLEADDARQLFVAELRVKYTPEATICGPQYGSGIWTVLASMEPTDGELVLGDSMVAGIDEDPAPTDPDAAALRLTDDQWAMVNHQLAALAGCGVWRDYDSPREWTQEELTLWLALRAQDWPDREDSLSESDVLRMAQADFSPENCSWNSTDIRLQESGLLSEGEVPLPAADPLARLDEQTAVEYRREPAQLPVPDEYDGMVEPDELVAVVTLETDEGPVCMEYRFGLIPEGVGPCGRTWLKQARRLAE